MAKYTITHVCGHTEEIQLFGNLSEREYRIKAMEESLCPECKAAQDAATCAGWGWVALEGTPKQVAYGNALRVKFRRNVWEKFEEKVNDPAKAKVITDILSDFVAKHTNAAYWIENKEDLTYFDAANRFVFAWYKENK